MPTNQDSKSVCTGQQPYFNRQATAVIKGIALIMMFLHHFFTFPEWWVADVSYPLLAKTALILRQPFKMCVPVFCFLTGYFYYFNSRKTFSYSLQKITDLLLSYWFVFLPYAVIAAVLVQPYTPLILFKEVFALPPRPAMAFCWYVPFYCLVMLLMPLMAKLLSGNIAVSLLLALVVIPYPFQIIAGLTENSSSLLELSYNLGHWLPCVLIGYLFAQHDLFEKLERLNRKAIRSDALNGVLWLLIALLMPMGRWLDPKIDIRFVVLHGPHTSPNLSIHFDCLFAALFIYAVVNLTKLLPLRFGKSVLAQIGKQSMLMWFLSCIFYGCCRSYFQPLLYFPRNPVLVLLWGLLLCWLVASALDFALKRVLKWKNRLLFKQASQ